MEGLAEQARRSQEYSDECAKCTIGWFIMHVSIHLLQHSYFKHDTPSLSTHEYTY